MYAVQVARMLHVLHMWYMHAVFAFRGGSTRCGREVRAGRRLCGRRHCSTSIIGGYQILPAYDTYQILPAYDTYQILPAYDACNAAGL